MLRLLLSALEGPRRHFGNGVLVYVALALVCLSGGSARAQRVNPPSPASSASTSAQETQQKKLTFSPLDTFYLRNEAGDLIPTFHLSFEEYERLIGLQEKQDSTPVTSTGARYQLLDANFDGRVDSRSEVSHLKLMLRIQATDTGKIEIPLGLKTWALAGPIESQIEDLSVDRTGSGELRLTFPAEAGQDHRLVLPLVSQLEIVGGDTQLRVDFPHTVPTSFTFQVDKSNITAEASGVIGFDVDETSGADSVFLTAVELSEDALLTWRDKTEDTRRFRTKAQLTTKTTLEALSISRWQGSATLQIKPLGQPMSELLVAVPALASDLTVVQNDVRIKKISWEEAGQHTAFISDSLRDRQYHLLTFLPPISEDKEITISYLLDSPEAASANAPAEFVYEGLHFFDTVFVSGALELTNTLRELDTTHVTSTGISLSRTPAAQKDTRGFDVSRQDYRLTIATRRRPAQVSIAPEYVLVLNTETETALMTVKFKGTVQGQFNEQIAIPLKRWSHLETEGLVVENGQLLMNPSTQMDLSSNNFAIQFSIQQPLQGSDIDLELPVPVSSNSVLIEPAELTVVLNSDDREFILDKSSSTFEAARTERTFRSKTGTDVMRLKGATSLKPRVVDFEHLVDMVLTPIRDPGVGTASREEVHVRQKLQFKILNQSLPRLWFPAEYLSPQCEVKLNGQVIPHKKSELEIDGKTWFAMELVASNIELRDSLLFEINDWALPNAQGGKNTTLPNVDDDSLRRWKVALIQPMISPIQDLEDKESDRTVQEIVRQQVETFNISRRSLQTPIDAATQYLLGTNWVSGPELPEATSAEQTWYSFGIWPTTASLTLKSLLPPEDVVLVNHVELQTWWERNRRLDRFVAMVETDSSQLEIRLPADAGLEQVLLNGEPAGNRYRRDEQRILLDLPSKSATDESSSSNRDVIVEIWLNRAVSASWWYHAAANPPELPNGRWCRDFRWRMFADGSWQCINWAPLFSQQDPGRLRPTSMEPEDRSQVAGRGRFDRYLTDAGEAGSPASLLLVANQIPNEQSLVLVNRYWLRVTAICLIFLLVLLCWWTELFRNFYFWSFLAFGFALVHASAPLLFGQVLPLVAFSLLAAIVVVLVDSVARRKPRIIAEMDTFVGSSRTMAGPASNGGNSQRDSARLIDSNSNNYPNTSDSNGLK